MASIVVNIFDSANQIQYESSAADGMLLFSHQGRHNEKVPRGCLLLKLTGLDLSHPGVCLLESAGVPIPGIKVDGGYNFYTCMLSKDIIGVPTKLSSSQGDQQIHLNLGGGDTRPASPVGFPADLADRELTVFFHHGDGGESVFCGYVAPNDHAVMSRKYFSATNDVRGIDRFSFCLREGQHIIPLKPSFSVRLMYEDTRVSASVEGFTSQPRPSAAILVAETTNRTYFLRFLSDEDRSPFKALPSFQQTFGASNASSVSSQQRPSETNSCSRQRAGLFLSDEDRSPFKALPSFQQTFGASNASSVSSQQRPSETNSCSRQRAGLFEAQAEKRLQITLCSQSTQDIINSCLAKPMDQILDDLVGPASKPRRHITPLYNDVLARIPSVISDVAASCQDSLLSVYANRRVPNASGHLVTALTMDYFINIILKLRKQRDEAYGEVASMEWQLRQSRHQTNDVLGEIAPLVGLVPHGWLS